jgi:type VI secretion system secreted protein Hcp
MLIERNGWRPFRKITQSHARRIESPALQCACRLRFMSDINIYLKLKLKQGGDVKGESSATGHTNEIIVDSFKWSEAIDAMTAGGRGGGVTGIRMKDFYFTMRMNKASPLIMLGSATCDTVLEATVSCRMANAKNNEDFLKWTLKDGLISSYETEATAKEMNPLDRFTIRFRSIAVDFRPTQADGTLGGTISARFDLQSLSGGG